jgi:ABC-type cobalamin/Fe3+-siderophores transport system ATPase subunit
MLIKDGEVLGMGNPEIVLSRDLLKESFDVDIEARSFQTAYEIRDTGL